MSLAWWWLLPLILLPMLGVAVWRIRRPAKKDVRFVGNAASLASLPSYKRQTQRARLLRIAEICLLGALLVTVVAIAARPQEQIRKVEQTQSRDIVLCVDVSSSMAQYVPAAFDTLRGIVTANPTDRYALVLFSNAPYVALPLTSDTVAIDLVASDLAAKFGENKQNAATLLGFDPASSGGTDIGGGLASCFRRFDTIEQPRSRHIILISDMDHNGETDQSAVATLLPKYGVKLYVLAPPFDIDTATSSPVTQITGAQIEELSDNAGTRATLASIFNSILNTRQSNAYVLADAPYPLWIAATLFAAGWATILIFRWRQS